MKKLINSESLIHITLMEKHYSSFGSHVYLNMELHSREMGKANSV